MISKELARIQRELKAPKGQFNHFGNYKYRSCEDILTAVKPLLGECTLTISDEIVLIGERYYIKATACLDYGENPAERHVGPDTRRAVHAYAREPESKKGMDESQITGAASSYARKYALNGLFAIDDTKDADTMDNRPQPQTSAHASAPVPAGAPDNPGAFVVPSGKYKGQTVANLAADVTLQNEFFGYVKWIKEEAKKKGKPFSGWPAEAEQKMLQHIASLK